MLVAVFLLIPFHISFKYLSSIIQFPVKFLSSSLQNYLKSSQLSLASLSDSFRMPFNYHSDKVTSNVFQTPCKFHQFSSFQIPFKILSDPFKVPFTLLSTPFHNPFKLISNPFQHNFKLRSSSFHIPSKILSNFCNHQSHF